MVRVAWKADDEPRVLELGDVIGAVLALRIFVVLRQEIGEAAAHQHIRLRVEELLDWLGKRLNLEWIRADLPAAAAPTPATPVQPVTPPGPEHRAALSESIDLGYMRGILKKLDEIEQLDPVHAGFVQVMRTLARRFQFEAMKEILRKTADGSH